MVRITEDVMIWEDIASIDSDFLGVSTLAVPVGCLAKGGNCSHKVSTTKLARSERYERPVATIAQWGSTATGNVHAC